ncbi:MAG: GNAT family N-acetyltransferase [Tabrizicola flagellatus]
MGPDFDIDRSSLTDVLRHLQAHDDAFQPPLSSRVNLEDYSRKLFDNAVRFEAWVGNDLVGLVAIYCNSKDEDGAFVSNVSVLAGHAGKGIARRLMQFAIAHVVGLGFSSMHLEVDRRAVRAMHLYLALGFRPTAQSEDGSISMRLRI